MNYQLTKQEKGQNENEIKGPSNTKVFTLIWFYDAKLETDLINEDVHAKGFSGRHWFPLVQLHHFENLREFTSDISSEIKSRSLW